jgi:uncharacterized protein
MRLGILSDTHDRLVPTQCAIELLRSEGAVTLVHCGDITGPEILQVCAVLPCYFTFGNHDADNVPLLKRAAADLGSVCLGWGDVIELADKRIGVAHGHMTSDMRRVRMKEPDYFLFGHSHIANDRREGPTRFINPGAFREVDELSVALLDLITGELKFLKISDAGMI